jgi:hypothetical protein
MIEWATPGRKVTMKKNKGWKDFSGIPVPTMPSPEYGKVYTIHEIHSHEGWNSHLPDGLYLSLEEFSPHKHFLLSAFVPVQEKKTDISVFTEMLITTKTPELV